MNTVWNLVNELSNKKGITEIAINSGSSVFVEREGEFIQLNYKLEDDDLFEFARDVASKNQKDFSESSPIVDGSLPDGSRVNIIGPPYVKGVPAITIRKFLPTIKKFESSPNVFSLSPKWVLFLKALVKAKSNIIISGGTGVGKTTFLNLLLQEIPNNDRVVTLEDTLELSFNRPNIVRIEARSNHSAFGDNISMQDLVKNTLRMRPDRIIIGEVRGGEMFDLLQAMNTGHEGSMSSVHANSTRECLSRIETLFLLAGHDVPLLAIRKQVASAVDFIIQISRDREGNRIVSQISEITGVEGDNLLLSEIAVMGDEGLVSTGIVPKHMNKLSKDGEIEMDFFK